MRLFRVAFFLGIAILLASAVMLTLRARAQAATEQWPDWTTTSTKIVPIASVGSPGVRLGFAQVTGPQDRVNQVSAVLQLDLVFQRTARIRVFIPSTDYTSVHRVQGVAVSALLQYQVFKF